MRKIFPILVLFLFVSGIVSGFSYEQSYTCDIVSGPNAGVQGGFTFMDDYKKAMLPDKENPSTCKLRGDLVICPSKEYAGDDTGAFNFSTSFYYIFDRYTKNMYAGVAFNGVKSTRGICPNLGNHMRYVYDPHLNMCVRLLAKNCR